MSILRADSIRDRAGTGAPDFPNGATVTGVVTATSFSGNVTGNADTATSATSATTATNAQGLTGTPNITVGTVTGTDATFSGNLTVQGTTTTIDTAVTAVDSLNVEGSVGIGTTGTPEKLTVAGDILIRPSDGNVNSGDLALKFGRSNTHDGDNQQKTAIIVTPSGGGWGMHDLHFCLNSSSDLNNVQLSDSKVVIKNAGTAIFKAGLAEKYNKGTTLAAASNNVALTSGNVHRFTSNESGAKTVNFTGVHSTLADGESVSFTVLVTPANAGYINAATVDGVAPGGGLKWSGGSAPSAGGASGRDVYTFTIFKDGTATNSYEIFGAVTNYA